MPRSLISDSIVALLTTNHLLSAPQLLRELHAKGQKVNKTTVYRALSKLLVEDKICQHNLHEDVIAYELKAYHHDHLICTHCNRIEVIHCPITLPESLSQYKIDHHHLTVYGLCPQCQGDPSIQIRS